MTAYNTGDLIEKAVSSVLTQSHKNLELMVIDDASTDDTLSVLKQLAEKDARMRVFHSPKNHGTYWSKNWCLAKATGEFVTFHDSDDVSDPQRLQFQLGAMLDGNGAVAATCRWHRIDPDGNELVIDGQATRTAMICLMIRREQVLQSIGYFDTVRIAADTEYNKRIKAVFGDRKVRNMRHRLYIGLLRDESLTRGEKGGFLWEADGHSIERTVLGDRAKYTSAFKAWHAGSALGDLHISFPQETRPFDAPAGILTGCDDRDVDQVIEVTGMDQ